MVVDATKRKRKTVVGKVTSDAMNKTIAVEVDRLVEHPRYHKYIRRTTRYYAHDERDEAKLGDQVRIIATRPLSKLKRWRLVEIVRPGQARRSGHEDEQL